MKRWTAGFAAAALVAGCSAGADGNESSDAGDDATTPPPTTSLTPFADCPDLLGYIKTQALDVVGPGGMPSLDWARGTEMLPEEGVSVGPRYPTDRHTAALLREAGIAQPDYAAADGDLLAGIAGRTLRLVDIGGDEPALAGTLDLPVEWYFDAALFLADDQAVVLLRERPLSEPGESVYTTTVLQVDVSDPTRPEVASTLEFGGQYLDAQWDGDTLRLVVTTTQRPAFHPMTEEEWGLPDEEVTELNRTVVENSVIEDWLPAYTFTRAGADPVTGPLVDCDRLSRPEQPGGVSTVSLLTLDLGAAPDAATGVGIISDTDHVYPAVGRMYVTTAPWDGVAGVDDPVSIVAGIEPADQFTAVHGFALDDSDPPEYLGSGEVAGRVTRLVAEDEVVRLLTGEEPADPAGPPDTELLMLQEGDDRLDPVGQLTGLPDGAEISAMSLHGPIGFLSTSSVGDSTLVADLSDPAAPVVSGELPAPQWPLQFFEAGSDRFTGIGAAPDSVRVTLVDAADPTDPDELDNQVYPGSWAWQATSDPLAVTVLPDDDLIVIPRKTADSPGYVATLVLELGDTELAQRGEVTRSPVAPPAAQSSIRRNLVADDTLYSLWEDGLQVTDLDDLDSADWVSFGQP